MRDERGEGGRGKDEREVPGSRRVAIPCGEQQQVRMRVSGGAGGGRQAGSRRGSCVDEPCGGRVRKGRTRAQEKSNDLEQDQGGPGGEHRSDPWRQIQPDADWPEECAHEDSKGNIFRGTVSKQPGRPGAWAPGPQELLAGQGQRERLSPGWSQQTMAPRPNPAQSHFLQIKFCQNRVTRICSHCIYNELRQHSEVILIKTVTPNAQTIYHLTLYRK